MEQTRHSEDKLSDWIKKQFQQHVHKRHILGSTSQRKVQSKRTGKDTLRKQQP